MHIASPATITPSGRRWIALLSALLLAIAAVTAGFALARAQGNVHYVDADAAGAKDGTSWANAYTSLQAALADAQSGDQIWVAAGVYTPTQRTDAADARSVTFQLKNGVALYGGFAGTESSLAQRNAALNITVLSGDIDGNDTVDANGVVTATSGLVGANAYHVIVGNATSSSAVLDGFTVTAGQANGLVSSVCGGQQGGMYGGGMCNQNSSPTVANVIFSGNRATNDGGGMYNTSASSPNISNVLFVGNQARTGGGMTNNNSSSPTLTNVSFTGNLAADGGGLANVSSQPTVSGGAFSSNEASDEGGGLYNNDSSPMLSNLSFSGNRAKYGGGMGNIDDSNPALSDISFSDNQAGDSGGGLYNWNSSPTLSNVSFTGNQAISGGGGMVNFESSNPTLTGVSFSNNQVTNGDGGGLYNANSSPTLSDVSFAANQSQNGGGMYNINSSPTLTDVSFTENQASSQGGGMYNINSSPTLTGVTFSENRAISGTGGGAYNMQGASTLTNVSFTANQANSDGGGMFNRFHTLTLKDASFTSNQSNAQGGGVSNLTSNLALTNVSFSGNQADYGGGMYSFDGGLTLTNVSFSGNQADEDGGGLYNFVVFTSTLTNVSFSGNLATARGGGLYYNNTKTTIQNSLFWNNRQGSEPGAAGDTIAGDGFNTPTFRYTLAQGCNPGGAWNSACGADGGNNLPDADPRFVTLPDPTVAPSTAGDLHLQAGSPAIDAGDNAADLDADGAGAVTIADVVTDLAGSARFFNFTVDLGAYESQSSQPVNHDIFLPMLSR